MYVLGISAYYHDSAAVLLRDGKVLAAAEEERFTRKKHDSSFPHHAVSYCLAEQNLRGEQIDHVAFYDKPFLKFERLIETYLSFAPRGFRSFQMAIPLWTREKLFQKKLLCNQLAKHGVDVSSGQLLFAEHHQSHAASAFFPSPFEDAVVLVIDGVGEWATTSAAIGSGNRMRIVKELHFPHSLGLLYSAFTYYTGFRVNSGEYKMMGLAPYGVPRFANTILDNLIDLKPDGSFRLDISYFDYCVGLRMTNEKFHTLFEGSPRHPNEPITQRHMDLAASAQFVLEHAVSRLAGSLADETGMPNLCLAGGVALNCVANGKLLRQGRFRKIWVQPAAGDAGGALGAALSAYHHYKGGPRSIASSQDGMGGSFLGPDFDQSEIERRLRDAGVFFRVLNNADLIDASIKALVAGEALGWFQGRMEFGPRALGARSILGDARSPTMQSILNLKVKKRESFRPFAPAILRDDVADWFDLDEDSPYMTLVANVLESHRRKPATNGLSGIERVKEVRSDIPAVTHVDYSARIQTVHAETNPRFHELLSAFKQQTGCPVLVNTSFNVRGEPIVCTPEDALRCFLGTEIDALAIGNCFLRKEEQRSPYSLRL